MLNYARQKQSQKQNGFTLLEVVMAVFIFTMLSLGIIQLVSGLLTTSKQQSMLLTDIDQARKVSYGILQELRNTNNSNTGAYPIANAQDQALTFFSQLPGTASGTFSQLRYFISAGTLYRGVLTPTGSPLTYIAANEVVTPVLNDVANGATPLFYYYDDNYNSTTNNTPFAQPVNINVIRFIKLNLVIYNKAGQTGTNTFTITAQTTLRNLKTNLGL